MIDRFERAAGRRDGGFVPDHDQLESDLARLVLPGVAPVDPGEQDGRGAAREGVVAGSRRERLANVAGAQAAKRKVTGTEVIETRVEARDLTKRHIHLGLVERARRGCSAEED